MSLHVHLAPGVAGAEVGATVAVEGSEAHHAVVVRRIAVGERIALTDGCGAIAQGRAVEAARQRLVVEVDRVARVPEPAPRLVVVQALPKGDRGELAVELLTEIGVARIVPWAASRSVAAWRGERGEKALARWRSTAREAAKQSRRAWFPEVEEPARTEDVVRLVAGAALAVVLHEEADVPLAGCDVPAEGTVVVVVGPEGGLPGGELAAFEAGGAEAVRLGSEVLRTSTAGVAAAAAILARTSRWRSAGEQ